MSMLKLVIKRSKWLRGSAGPSCLLRSDDNKMCCLGFLARTCGYSRNDIKEAVMPSSMFGITDTNKFPKGLLNRSGDDTKLCNQLAGVNDLEPDKITDAKRESKLKALFKRINIRVQFVD